MKKQMNALINVIINMNLIVYVMIHVNMEHFMMKKIRQKNANVKMKNVLHVLPLEKKKIYVLLAIIHFIL